MAVLLDGNDGINLGSPAALNGALCLIIAFRQTTAGTAVIYGEGAAGSQIDWCISTFGGKLNAYVWLGSGAQHVFDSVADITVGVDYIVALRLSTRSSYPAVADLFVNGGTPYTVGSVAVPNDGGGSDAAHIGYGTYGDGVTPDEFFTGIIYQVLKLDVAPSDAAINALTLRGAWVTQLGVSTSHVLGYWPLVSNATDSGPNGINGTLISDPVFDGGSVGSVPPTAHAGTDQTTTSGGTVAIGAADTAGSSSITGRAWTQIAPTSPAGVFDDTTVAAGNWTAPTVLATTVFTLRKTVTDGTLSSSDDVQVTVEPASAGVAGFYIRWNGEWV